MDLTLVDVQHILVFLTLKMMMLAENTLKKAVYSVLFNMEITGTPQISILKNTLLKTKNHTSTYGNVKTTALEIILRRNFNVYST